MPVLVILPQLPKHRSKATQGKSVCCRFATAMAKWLRPNLRARGGIRSEDGMEGGKFQLERFQLNYSRFRLCIFEQEQRRKQRFFLSASSVCPCSIPGPERLQFNLNRSSVASRKFVYYFLRRIVGGAAAHPRTAGRFAEVLLPRGRMGILTLRDQVSQD